MIYLNQLEHQVREYLRNQDIDSALKLLIDFVQDVVNDQQTVGQVFSSKRLDDLCAEIAQLLNSVQPYVIEPKKIVIITTELGIYGGHTRVIEDFIGALPGFEIVTLVTDLLDRQALTDLPAWFAGEVAPRYGLSGKLSWLCDKIVDLRPARIFLFNFNQDAVAVTAALGLQSLSRVFFFHHADHHLCLGVKSPGFVHVDFHNTGFYNCRICEEIEDNKYIPLFVSDRGVDKGRTFYENSELNTCSSGGWGKFNLDHEFSYIEMIALRLESAGGKHYHIGNIEAEQLSSFYIYLEKRNIDASRFIHIPWVASVWQAMQDLKIDLYINSFPVGGGRASVEVMGSGTPMLIHECSLSRFHGGPDLIYPGVHVWRSAQDFEKCFRLLSTENLRKHSQLAREYYLEYHQPSLFAKEMPKLLEGNSQLLPPDRKPFVLDPLERYIQLKINSDDRWKIYSQQHINIRDAKILEMDKEIHRLNIVLEHMKQEAARSSVAIFASYVKKFLKLK